MTVAELSGSALERARALLDAGRLAAVPGAELKAALWELNQSPLEEDSARAIRIRHVRRADHDRWADHDRQVLRSWAWRSGPWVPLASADDRTAHTRRGRSPSTALP